MGAECWIKPEDIVILHCAVYGPQGQASALSFGNMTRTPVDDYTSVYPFLLGRVFPDLSGKTATLLDGRLVGYQEYVDQCKPEDSLKVIVLIPGSPGSRFFTHPIVKREGCLKGCRLIVMERPGIGLSDPYPELKPPSAPGTSSPGQDLAIVAFAPVFEAFCDAVGLTSVHLVGYSAGTPYALAAACRCRPGLIKNVALLGAVAPPYPGIHKGMALFFRFGYWACTAWPWFVGWVVRSEGKGSRHKPLASLRQSFAPYLTSKGDKAALARPEVEEMFLESLLETASRTQGETVLQENLRFARPWGFALTDIRLPVAVWQGEEDVGCTQGMARYLASKIPGCQCSIVPGKGHMAWMEEDIMEEMLAWLTQAT